jgi:hypothetical protein
MMVSESAHMSSMAEARFRVQAPNSTPRATTVIALDAAGEAVVRRLAGAGWEHATFFTAIDRVSDRPGPSTESVLTDLSGRSRDLAEEIHTADLVVMVAGPGGSAHQSALIGRMCGRERVMTTGFIVTEASVSESDLSKTLTQVRPWSLMVVIANNDDYISDMLSALRA